MKTISATLIAGLLAFGSLAATPAFASDGADTGTKTDKPEKSKKKSSKKKTGDKKDESAEKGSGGGGW